ncbi:hypothetical protein C8F04DRAFT_1193161 [Mycena alexandri]|uniref:Uncharacterized protein n=1 Tax=Mycena alexandri TaxID=1745969 RepID=A0AAD6SAN2_9AGAR|nr:hypothetical protein C8F04DRAFT_1193161 [Mycena alexandri]
MSDIPPEPPYNHLKHLSECPTCFGDAARQNQYMTHVFMSQGRNNPETEGCWGQKCLNNPGGCTKFQWAEGIPRGPRKPADCIIACPGKDCLHRVKARQGNNSCHIALCQTCCVLAHAETPSIGPCPCATHRESLKKALPPPAASASLPATPGSSRSPAVRSYAIPLSETYKRQLLENDKNLERVLSAAENRSFSRQTAKTIVIQWWSVNGAEPDTMDVQAPHYPHFHPAHSPDLVSLYAADTTLFEFFHSALDIWKLCSINTPAQIVDRDIVLLFRSRGVRAGIGMPQGSILTGRLGQNNQLIVGSQPPATFATFSPQDMRSEGTVSPFDSPSPFRPPVVNLGGLISFDSSNSTSASASSTSSTFASTSMEGSSSGPSEATLRSIVDKAARGPSKGGWPFISLRDMAAGFMLLDALGVKARNRPEKFQEIFGCEYKNPTYAENRRVWDRACRMDLDPQKIIGEIKPDTWSKFRAIHKGKD